MPSEASGLQGEVHPVLRRIYAARGVRSHAELLLALRDLLPVTTLSGTQPAAELLYRHRQGSVMVIGDFDADGATSTALLVRALRSWGFAGVDFLVPNRFEFGYGLTAEIVELAARRRPTLIVTVDNGIASHAGVDAARAAGIEVLITDHHLP
ncbi:MAG TPA: DHH family phosphoesterase, partial [Steroidobacteraceae bacterium]|nr:DHH family phosphoesterase [Steroidobacteraceae bacterium]